MVPDLTDNYRSCSVIAGNHYENFPVASWMLPAKQRPHIHAIYAFARTADDFADEAEFEGRRLEEIGKWRDLLDTCVEGKTQHPLFLALANTIQEHQLPIGLFHDLLNAFEQDVHQNRYQTWEEIVAYAKKSADPIGRLYLQIHGFKNEEMNRYADCICSALQFANFWQDVSVDLKKDRIYIPTTIMKQCGYSEEELLAGVENDAFRDTIKVLVNRTFDMFTQGRALLPMLHGRLKKELSMIVMGGEMILRKVVEQNYNVLHKRPKLSGVDKVKVLTKVWMGYAS